nr:unnamed protein product [Spirometra erinaceieuropaei]
MSSLFLLTNLPPTSRLHSLSLEEKNILERSRVTSLEQLASMQKEVEQLRQMLQTASRERDEIAEQRDEKRLAYESETRETARLQRLLDQAESRCSQLREKITELQDLQRRTQMEKDVLSHEKTDVLDRAEKAEQKLADTEKKVANMRKDGEHLHDTIVRLENIAEARECERSEMAHQLHLVQANETRLAEERNSLRTECQRLRNQLSRAEMEHSAANAETERLKDALAQAERLHKQVEAEVAVVSKERFELTEALAASSRQTNSLTEELDNLRRETGLQANTINRLTSEKEELLQEKTDLTSRISVAERERRQLTDLVAKLRTDKEVLENEAFIAQRVITDLKNKEEKLETDVANLTLRRKNLQAEVHRIRTDFEVELAKIQRQRDRLDTKYTSELDELRMALANADRRLAEAEEAAVQAVLRADRAAAEAAKATMREADRHGLTELECQRWAEEQGQLNAEILVAQRERDEALRKAEQEHQRVLAMAAEDQAAVRERAMLLQETIVDLEKTLERTKREAASRAEKDEIALKTTTEDLHKCREQLEETCASHEREVLGFRTQIKALQENYEMASKELSNAQLQLRLQAESRLTNRTEASETAKLLRDSEESCSLLRRECLEFRKRQSELEAEKCSLEAANSDLRRQLRTLELERVEQGCSLTELQSRLEACDQERRTNERLLLDLRQSIEDAGKSDVTARREVSELRLQLKETDTLNEQLKQTVSDLRASLVEELANVEEMKRESVNLRQRLTEAESVRHSLQTELSLAQRRLTESEEKLRSRERTMSQALEDCKRDTKRVEESKQLLQSRLETAEQQVSTVRASLATQEGRIRSLQNDLNWMAALRKDAEARLAAIHGLLRRLLGFRQSLRSTGWVNTTPDLAITPALRSKVRTAPTSDQQETGTVGETDKEAVNGGSAAVGSPHEGNKTLISERRAGDDTGASPSSSRRARSSSPDKRYMDIESRSLSGERHLSRLQTSAWSDIFCEAKESALDFGKSPASESSPTGHAVSVPDCTTSFSGISAMPYGLRKRLARLAASSSYLQSVPGSDLDPDAVCSALRELLRHLLRLERDRDDALLAVRVRDEKTQDQKAQLAERDDLIGQLRTNQRKLEEDNKILMERIMDVQSSLSHQESATGRAMKERDALQSTINDLQKRLSQLEAEGKQLQERLSISRMHVVKSNDECRLMRRALEDSESRVNAAEVARRNLETEFQRQRNTLTDRSAELQASNTRLDSALKDLSAAENRISELNSSVERLTQMCNRNAMTESEAKDQAERLTTRVNELQHENAEMHERLAVLQRQLTASDHENRILQERNDNTQSSLYECKNQMQQMHDRIQKLQTELSEGDLLRSELETQNRQLNNQLGEQDNVQKDLLQQLLTLQCNKENVMEKLSALTKSNTECEKEKADLEAELKQQKSEMQQLRKTLDRMNKERMREKEASSRLLSSQDDVKKNVRQLEEENLELRRHLQRLQAQIILQDEAHMNQLEEVSKRKNAKIEAELEKKCSALMHSEKVLQAKERSHRQRIKGLEEQIRTLSDQLTQEISRRHLYMSTGKLPTSPAAAVPLTYSASASLRGRYPSGPGSSHASFLLSHASRETLVHQSNIDTEPVKEDDQGRTAKSKPPSGIQSTAVCESQPSIAESQVTKSGRAQPMPLESSERTPLGLLRVASSGSSQLMESPKKYSHHARSASLDMDY